MEICLVKGNRIDTLLKKVSMKVIQYIYTRSEQKVNQMAMIKIGKKRNQNWSVDERTDIEWVEQAL